MSSAVEGWLFLLHILGLRHRGFRHLPPERCARASNGKIGASHELLVSIREPVPGVLRPRIGAASARRETMTSNRKQTPRSGSGPEHRQDRRSDGEKG